MQVITPELEAILKSKLQAGPDGFRGRVEIDRIAPPGFEDPSTGTAWNTSILYLKAVTPVYNVGAGLSSPGSEGQAVDGTGAGGTAYPTIVPNAGSYYRGWEIALGGVYEISKVTQFSTETPNVVRAYLDGVEVVGSAAGSFASGNDDWVGYLTTAAHTWTFDAPVVCDTIRVNDEWSQGGLGGHQFHTCIQILARGAAYTAGLIETDTLPALEISIDKSLRLDADQAEVIATNEGLALGWGDDTLYPTNSRVRIFQWFGDPENEVQTFTGILDRFVHSRDPLMASLTCRDMMGVLIDDRFSTIGPQGLDEEGAVRTEANGVYQDVEVDYIVADQLDRAGFPEADREIAETSFAVREYVIADGASRSEVILELAAMVGYSAWCDELGVFHFAPTFAAGAVLEPPDPAYTFRAGEDLVSLSDVTDQQDLITRVKARGPLTTIKDAWTEVWRTRKIAHPLDVMFQGDTPEQIHVLDKSTKRLYRIRQSDRKILGYTSLGGAIPYPSAVSADPANDAHFWVLSTPWRYGGSTSGNRLYKVRWSDKHVIARMSLPAGEITAMKVSENWIWFTRRDTDRVYKRNRSDASAAGSWSVEYWTHDAGVGDPVTQVNPKSLMIDGSTLWVFWTNGDKLGRWLVSDEATPDVIDNAVYMSGTRLFATEISTNTHIHAFGVHPQNGIVAKFKLTTPFDEATFAEVVDTELEHELGELAQLEPRIHDTHPDDPAHPFEVRRSTLEMRAIASIAQATEVAMRQLELWGRRRRVLDAGILGNPALQKTDLVRVEDPVSGIAQTFTIDTCPTQMRDTYLGTLALLPVDVDDDDPDDDGDAEDDLEEEDPGDVVDDEEALAGYFLSPSGNDTTGDGTEASPWRTFAKFAAIAAAGDTLYCRGGTYTGTTRATISGVSGSPSSRITVRNYPGETPVFRGNGPTVGAFAMFTGGSSYWTIDGLEFENFRANQDGVIWIGDASVDTHHVTIRRCTFRALAGGDFSEQQVYLSYHADDCTIEDNVFVGTAVGGDGGTGCNIGGHDPGPTGFLVQRNIFDGFGHTGAVWVGSSGSAGSILHNTFVGCNANIFLGNHSTILVRDNAGETASNGSHANLEDIDPGDTTADHNFWGQSFDAGYLLVAGQSGRGAASDGSDAGALDW